jgi:hypothetical protein
VLFFEACHGNKERREGAGRPKRGDYISGRAAQDQTGQATLALFFMVGIIALCLRLERAQTTRGSELRYPQIRDMLNTSAETMGTVMVSHPFFVKSSVREAIGAIVAAKISDIYHG